MELVDLYNEDRIPLGKVAERYAPREEGAFRAVVHVCIFNRKGEMLIQRRTMEKVIWPGRWDVSAAGGVDAGESSRQAAEREVREELGYPLDLTGIRASMTVNFDAGFDDFFLVEQEVDLTTLHLQPEEVSEVRWASCEEVLTLVDRGAFCCYPKSFLQFLFDMRGTFGFATK